MKQVVVKAGEVVVEEVAAPAVEPGTLLILVDHSCISAGTEVRGVEMAETPLWRRAVAEPAKVKAVADLVRSHGVAHARAVVRGRTGGATPLGYSAAGTVIAVGDGVEGFRPGMRVACAGAGVANHAEVVRVPLNLVVAVPDVVPLAHASTVTLGAIALQGVRRAHPTLGETVLVLGLGAIGQFTVQLLKAHGARVVATDLDSSRVELACRIGADVGVRHPDSDLDAKVAAVSEGVGVDAVIVTAATSSSQPINTAIRCCRKKGRVVVVGDVGLDLRRHEMYERELDVLISTSYGPGRYDRRYEEEGLDYPIGWVRWTENRNMAEVIRLMAEGRLQVEPLVGGDFPVASAPLAYARLRSAERPLLALLSYPADEEAATRRTVPIPSARPASSGRLRLALVGAGAFATSVHLPLLAATDHVQLRAVVSRSGHRAADVAAQFGAAYSSTDVTSVLEDDEVDAVLIATRHHLHASLALAALSAGKHTLVEKPLAMTREEMEQVAAFFAGKDHAPILLTGFNRRFSPFAVRLAELLDGRSAPTMLAYRMNAGYLPPDHWVHGPEGGGRNVGEACHVYDLLTFLTGARLVAVQAAAASPAPTSRYRSDDNFVATISFADGSVGTLVYTALGTVEAAKERLDAFWDGQVATLDDYRSLDLVGTRHGSLRPRQPDKGHRGELESFVRAALRGGEWPIPLWQQLQATEIALSVQEALSAAAAVGTAPADR